MSWRATGLAAATLPPGGMREVLLGSTSVLVVRAAGELRAVEGVCPHQGGLLVDGNLSGTRVTCPDHEAAFDVTDGRVLADPHGSEPPEGAVGPLSTYPVRIRDGMVEVDVP